MKIQFISPTFPTILTALLTSVAFASAAVQEIRYSTSYDDPDRSLNSIACSNGPNGLETTHGWYTQGEVTTFPFIGASDWISGWNSPNCGKCFSITYQGNTVYFLALDVSRNGVVTSLAALNYLTRGNGEFLGTISAGVEPVEPYYCHI